MKSLLRFPAGRGFPAAVLLFSLLLASCPRSNVSPNQSDSPAPSPTGTDVEPLRLEPRTSGGPISSPKAVVVYIEGSAEATRSGQRFVLDFDEPLETGDILETGPKSACEIKLGDAALVRMEENSVLSLDSLLLERSGSRVSLSLRSGTILNKVGKLLNSESYVVRTPSMVCGVRGTEFAVRAENSGYTMLSVNEGAVKALPSSNALDRLADAAKTNGLARTALQALISLGPEVGAGMELSIGPEDVRKAEKAYAGLEKAISNSPPEPVDPSEDLAGTIPAADLRITESANAARIRKLAEPAAGFGRSLPASEKTKAIFSGFERMRLERPETTPKAKSLDPAILGVIDSGGKPAVGDIVQFKGLVLVSNTKGEIAAYDAKGREVWRTQTGNPESKHSYPVVFKDKVYYSGARSFDVIDGGTGEILLSKPHPVEDNGLDGLRPYQFPEGILAPHQHGIDIVSPETGETLDTIEVPEGLMMSPAALKTKTVVYVTTTGLFRLVRASDKKAIKEIQTQARGISQQSLRNRGTLYFFADGTGMAVLIDVDADEPVWERRVDGALTSEAEMGKSAVYLPTESGLAILGISDGEIIDILPGISGPPLLSNDDLFLCTDSGELIVARANPYTELTRISLPFVGSARPLIVGKTLWVAGRGGKMVRIDPELLKRRAKSGS